MARSVLVMQPASQDTEDDCVVITCAKNNDGELGKRTAWERKNGLFVPAPGFNFEEFDRGGEKREAKVKEEHIRQVFKSGQQLMQNEAVKRLQEVAQVGRTAAYDALKIFDGRFSDLLSRDSDGRIGLRPPTTTADHEEDGVPL